MSKDRTRQKIIANAKHELRKLNSFYGPKMVTIPREEWPESKYNDIRERIAVWRSNRFLVQVFKEPNAIIRLSVNRAWIDDEGYWCEGITWDELQQIKNECGFAPFDAVEVFPRADDVVNVAHVRHLWVMPQPLEFAWRNRK